jgi:hypothetical protein
MRDSVSGGPTRGEAVVLSMGRAFAGYVRYIDFRQ